VASRKTASAVTVRHFELGPAAAAFPKLGPDRSPNRAYSATPATILGTALLTPEVLKLAIFSSLLIQVFPLSIGLNSKEINEATASFSFEGKDAG